MSRLLSKILLLDSIPDRAVELFASYIGPAVFLVVGALLAIVGLLLQEERPDQSIQAKGYKPRTAKATQLGSWVEIIHDVKVPRWLRYGLIFTGLALLLVGIAWVVILFTREGENAIVPTATPTIMAIPTGTSTLTPIYANIPTATTTPAIPISTPTPQPESPGLAGIALSSLRYQANGGDSRQVDLRHAAIDGIQVYAGESLVLNDLWVSAPEEAIGLKASFELRSNGEVIGRTGEVIFQSGGALFVAIKPIKFVYPGVENGFKIQEDWELLELVLFIRSGSTQLQSVVTPIVLNKNGNAWYITPPYAHLVSIVYSINDHPKLAMDLSAVLENGLTLSSEDKLTIHEIWYKSEQTVNDKSLQIEAYPSSGNFEAAQQRIVSWTTFRMGIHNLLPDDDPFVWENIPGENKWLIITLSRNDKTILDRYVIPFKTGGGAGMIPANQAIRWPFDRFTYLDFEAPGSVNSWLPLGRNTIAYSSARSFSGNSSLAIAIRSSSEQRWVEWDQPFTADYLLGQVFWPQRPGISVSSAKACEAVSGQCVSIPTRSNEWNTFVIQFSQWKYKNLKMNEVQIPYIYFQGSIDGIADTPYTFYIDGIQLYPSSANP
jgi:hypothetical protein